MKKDLLQLTTYEFASVLLGHSPKYHMTLRVKGEDGKEPDELIGTYKDLMETIADFPDLKKQVEDTCFDYDMELDEPDTIRYMRHRTEDFNPDLTKALLNELDFEEFEIFDEIEYELHDSEKFRLWKSTSTYSFYRAKGFLRDKVEQFKKAGLLTEKPFEILGIPGCGIKEIDEIRWVLGPNEHLATHDNFKSKTAAFKRYCYKLARSGQDKQIKEEKIIDMITTLDGIFLKASEMKRLDIQNRAVELFAVIESAFMSSPVLICVKDICIQLGMCSILDAEEDEVIFDGLPSRSELGLSPMTREEVALKKELGASCSMRQRKICELCLVKPCQYQYGRRRFELGKDEEYDEATGEHRWTQFALRQALTWDDAGEKAIATTNVDEDWGSIFASLSAVEHFQSLYSSTRVVTYIESLIGLLGLDPYNTLRKAEHLKESFINDCKQQCADFTLPDYDRWDELHQEIIDNVKRKKDDDCELNNYIFSLLTPFEDLCTHISPNEEDILYLPGAVALQQFADDSSYSPEDFKKLWRETEEYVKTLPEYKNCSTPDYYEMVTTYFYIRKDKLRLPIIGGDSWTVTQILESLRVYAATIEGALLSIGYARDVYYYINVSGVHLCKSLKASEIASAMNWTNGQVSTYIEKYKHSTSLNPQKDNEDEEDNEEPEVVDDEATKVRVNSRLEQYESRASSLFVDGKWHNSVIKDYAIFLKVLYGVVYRKEEGYNVSWSKLNIRPLSDGSIVTPKQLSNAVRSIDADLDEAKINQAKAILGE